MSLEALGMVETRGLVAAIEAADAMNSSVLKKSVPDSYLLWYAAMLALLSLLLRLVQTLLPV